MALVSMRELLDHAATNGYGLPAFNVNNLEQVQAVMSAADETGAPVILQASAGARKYAGESFSDYLLRIRMKEAQLLLSNTDLRTYEIAYKVGYDNPTYFSTLFKRFTGMTV